MREEEKMEREIEKLKVETEYKRQQLGRLKECGDSSSSSGCMTGRSQSSSASVIRPLTLPVLTLPSFCGMRSFINFQS